MQVSREPGSAAQPQTTTAAAASLPRAAVRMYRQGLGDCFLVSLRRDDGTPWRLLIDCGVILGTPDTSQRLTEVIANIVADTRGRVDVLAITHEHYDHVAAFAAVANLFCADDADRKPEQLQIGEVWFAWSEDPGDPFGNKLRKTRAEQINKLAAMVAGLRARSAAGPASQTAESVAILLGGFFGIEDFAAAASAAAGTAMVGGAAHVGATAQAMQNARSLGGANAQHVRYWKPGDPPWSDKTLPGVRIYILGPPRDEALLKKTFATDEVYGLATGDAANAAFFTAAGMVADGSAAGDDSGAPFDAIYGRSLHELAAMPPGTRDFLDRRYYGPAASDSGSDDQSWRQIDADWLNSAAQFALNLDAATNNTSLVLAIELPGGEILLFPADAQVGNWLSWQKVEWKEGDKTLTAPDLLQRTVLYKVGHHGSHNATLRSKGLELMPLGLTALIPVDHDMAVKKHWDGMPLPQLIDALKERNCIVVRMDDPEPPPQSRVRAGPPASSFAAALYYEWSFDK